MKDKVKLISSMLIFGSIGLFVRNINLSSMEIAFIRAVIGSLFLICTGFIIKQKISFEAIKQNIVLLGLSGVFIGFNWILLFQAYKYTTISNATLSYYFAPVFVIILSPVILKERITVKRALYIAVAMIGLFFIVNTSGSNNGDYNHVTGVLYGLSAAVLYATVILMNKFIKGLGSFETTLVQLGVAALILLPVITYHGGIGFSSLSIKTIILIFIVGTIHTGIAYLLYFTSIKDLKSQSIAILSYIDPISAVLFAALFIKERMSIFQVVGGMLILGATFLSEKQKE
jgi:drug/metabolite transporter (DMT)-like permease